MLIELFYWSGKSSEENKACLRAARRRFLQKHGMIPNLLMVRENEYQKWMGNMGISVKQVDGNLAPKHFTLEFVGRPNEQSPNID